MEMNMEKNELLRTAAKEFAEKIQRLPTPRELAIVGSVAGDDPYPNDLDLALILQTLDEISTIATYARQMSKWCHAWEVFLFDEDIKFLGRICHRKGCPGQSIDCAVPGCGTPHHVRRLPGFEYKEEIFFHSPVEVLWTTYTTSRLLARKKERGIVESRKYLILQDITLECMLCGAPFVFSGGEQKWYQKRGLNQPKRCENCREENKGYETD
jgi:hypothetical protein